MNGYYQQAYYNSHDSRKSQRSPHQYFQHPAFGGTLSPMLRRQRAFHDAIYEEEYGSDQEDECCQSRGMSAVFCWFLSVIILIGLAASVVLTVFFILKRLNCEVLKHYELSVILEEKLKKEDGGKSHMSKNGELDLFLDGDHGISYHMPDTTTELNSNLDFSSSAASSKEASIPSSISIEDDDNNDETENNIQFGTLNKSAPKSSITSTTRFPPSRKGPTEISDEKVLRPDTSRSAETTRRTSPEPPRTSPELRESTTERPKSDESKSHESSKIHTSTSTEDHLGTLYTTTTTGAPVQQILFTSSPDIIVTPTGHRRNLQTTRFPTGRTSFSTSTPTFVSTQNDDNTSSLKVDEEENKSQNSPPVVTQQTHEDDEDNDEEEDEDENTEEDKTQEEPHLTLTTRQEEPVTSPSTIVESREQTTEADSYKSEESQLNKMLLDEIPPHDSSQRKEQEEEEDSHEENDSSEEETSQSPTYSSEFNLPATTTTVSRPTSTVTSTFSTTTSSTAPPPAKDNVRLDPLARLIKNLAPKWGRNRTVETTTLSSGSHKYDFTISSKEKDNKSKTSQESTTPEYSRTKSKYKSKETSTRSTLLVTPEGTRTRFQNSRPNSPAVETVSILNTIKSPDLSRRHDQEPENSEGVGQFLDILVGSDDHKTLITKQTEDGIVTSAILPPWFNNPKGPNNGKVKENSTSTTTTTASNTSTPPPASNSPGETSSEEETSYSGSASEEGSGSDTASVFGGLFDLFKKEVAASITPTTTNTPTTLPNDAPLNPPDYDPKRIILKRPGGELLAQGSSNFVQNSGGNTNGILNGDKIPRKPALSFRDMIRTAAPSLLSTTTIATVDPAVVTDDITSANNNFHFNSPDGGTNIYGYYPDEDDKEQDKTVEHLGIQSESMSDEVLDRVNPSHSIEVQVPDESAEIVIQHDNGSSADPKFGETPAESTNHGKFVEPPIFHGGGIRRPLEEDEDLLSHGDLEVNSSEAHPVFAVPVNATSAVPSPANNNKNRTNEVEQMTKRVSYVSPSGTISREVVDNSAEKDPAPNSEGGIGSLEYEDDASLINPQNPQVSSVEKAQSPTGTGGSYEEDLSGNGAHETPHTATKWSETDKYGSTEADPSAQASVVESHEVKDTEEPGNTNDVLERKPVVNLDEKLYPDSTGDTSGGTSVSHESVEANKVHQVFPEGQSNSVSSTTERPAGESSLSQPDSSDSSKSHENKGFMPPTPVSFHDNKYTFSPPPPDSIYQSKDGWRPIMKTDGAESSRPVSTQTPFWRTRQPILIPTRHPTSPSTPPATNPANINTPATKPLDNGSSQQLLEEDEEYEEEEEEVGEDGVPETDAQDQELNNYSWGNRDHLMEQPQSSQLPTKVKFPEQTQEDFEQDIEPQPQKLQVQQHLQQQPHPIQMMTQPHPPPHQQQQIPQMQQHPQQHQQQRPHPQQPHPQQQRPVPKQMQHLPPHHVTHQQRQQFLYQNNQHNQQHNQNIDRSKYLMRPAPPPIVMRRAPIQNMPYLPSRDGPARQGLVAQVVPPQNQATLQNDPSPSEFHQQYNLRRRFKTLGARPRSSNLNWPAEETSGSDSITAREPVGERRAAG